MGNKQKFGSRRNAFKKRKCVGVQNRPLAAENDSQTPVLCLALAVHLPLGKLKKKVLLVTTVTNQRF